MEGTATVDAAPAANAPVAENQGPPEAALAAIEEARTSVGLPPSQAPAADATPSGDEGASAEPTALDIDPRLVKAAERIHLSKEDIAAQVKMFGKEAVEKALAVHADALDAHSAALGADGRAKKDGEPKPKEDASAAPAEPVARFDDAIRETYAGDADLLDATERLVSQSVAGINERYADVEQLLFEIVADRTIRDAGEIAKDVKPKDLLLAAETLASGYAVKGVTKSHTDILQEALKAMTSTNAAAAARSELRGKVEGRSRQVSGPPSGRTVPAPTGEEAKKNAALAKIEAARQKQGLPPSRK